MREKEDEERRKKFKTKKKNRNSGAFIKNPDLHCFYKIYDELYYPK